MPADAERKDLGSERQGGKAVPSSRAPSLVASSDLLVPLRTGSGSAGTLEITMLFPLGHATAYSNHHSNINHFPSSPALI